MAPSSATPGPASSRSRRRCGPTSMSTTPPTLSCTPSPQEKRPSYNEDILSGPLPSPPDCPLGGEPQRDYCHRRPPEAPRSGGSNWRGPQRQRGGCWQSRSSGLSRISGEPPGTAPGATERCLVAGRAGAPTARRWPGGGWSSRAAAPRPGGGCGT